MISTHPVDIIRRVRTLTSHRIHALPVVVLMPHGGCDCRCVMCDIWLANKERRRLDICDLEPHLQSFRKLRVRRFVLSGGEALLHDNLWELCRLLRELGAGITLLSTGLQLEAHATDVVQHCDDVIVSLDGPPQTHDAVRRVPRAFERLAAGIAALRDAQPGFRVTGRSVVQRANYALIESTIDTARRLGLDSISFLGADTDSDAFNRPEGWDEDRVSTVALSLDQAHEFATIIERLISQRGPDIASGFIAESPQRLRDLAQHSAAAHGEGEPPARRCNAPWVSAVVEADGRIRPCFFHPPYATLADGPLHRSVNSDAAIAFRRQLDVAKDPICRVCVCTLQLSPFRSP
jgi:MoaA/NifB/PqqE/SkfB family radical SAM enzyme